MPAEQEAARLAARIGADTSGLAQGFNNAQRMVQQGASNLQRSASIGGGVIGQSLVRGFEGGLGGLTMAAMRALPMAGLILGTARLGREAVELAVDMDDVAQSTERAWRTWQNLTGPDAYMGMQRLREATLGAADDQTLMAGATKFLTMGLAKNTEEAARMAEMATQLGMAMNMPGGPTQAMDYWARLLANQSIPRLDDFGISSGKVRDRIEELTSAEEGMNRETAFVTATMEQAEIAMARVGQQVPITAETMGAAVTNLRRNLAVALSQTDVGQAFSLLRKGFVGQLSEMAADIGRNTEIQRMLTQFGADIENAFSRGTISPAQRAALLGAYTDIEQGVQGATLSLEQIAPRIADVTSEMAAGTPIALKYAQALENVAGFDLAGIFSMITREVQAASKALGDPKFRAATERYMTSTFKDDAQRLSYLKQKLETMAYYGTDWLNTSAEINALEQRLDDDRASRTDRQLQDMKRLTEARASMIEQYARQALQPTRVTGMDMLATQMGLYGTEAYPEKPDEYLRRLRSAVYDAKSLWKNLLGGRGGAEAEFYLLQQEQLWGQYRFGEMGPGFDYGAMRAQVIAQVRASVEAQRGQEAFLASIVNDPALADLGLTSSEIARITGEPSRAAGIEAAQGWTKGWKSQASFFGIELGDMIGKQFEGTEDAWHAMGELSMEWLSEGQSEATSKFLNRLVNLMFPAFFEKLTDMGGRP